MKRFLSIALAIVMIFALAAVTFAEEATEHESPTPQEYFDIDVTWTPSDGSLGDATADKYTIVRNSDGTVTITANPKGDGSFTKWEIGGDYEVIEGDLTTPTITIKPLSDLEVNAVFESGTPSTETGTTKPTTAPKPNNNTTSPKTGDPLFLIIALVALALGTGAYAVKKIKA